MREFSTPLSITIPSTGNLTDDVVANAREAGATAVFARPTPEGWVDDTAAVGAMVDALGAVITRMRERVDATGEADPVSQDLLIAVTGDLEKQHWMFQAENG